MPRSFKRFAVLAAALAVTAGAAEAQGVDRGRYTMSPTDGGFVRLDTLTGEMAFCRRDRGQWQCEAMAGNEARPDDRSDIDPDARIGGERGGIARPGEDGEMARLRRENRMLREEIDKLDERLGLGRFGTGERAPRGDRGPVPGLNLPSEKEVDRALEYFGNVLRKFRDEIRKLEKPADPGAEKKEDEAEPEKPRTL